MKTLTTIVVDDDPLVLKSMSILCSKSPNIELLRSFSNGIEALNFLKENQVDLILIDLDMPNMSGWDVIELLPYKPYVIVISSKKEQANKGYRFQLFDFLTKPVSVAQFIKTVERLLTSTNHSSKDHLFVKIGNEMVRVKHHQILYVKALGDYVQIQLTDQKLTLHSTLKALLTKLPENLFCQCHRSYAVNLNKIDKVLTEDLQIAAHEIPVSKSKMPILKQQLGLV